MIIIVGSPRSGTTWFGTAFSSHPETLYLHEPDIDDRGDDLLPYWFSDAPLGYEKRANHYLSRLSRNRALRVIGVRPFFDKVYRSNVDTKIRAGLIYIGKGLERNVGHSIAKHIQITDLVRVGFAPKIVIKTVSALGRVEAFLKSGIKISPILMVRHPCAQVHSYLRGVSQGLMPSPRMLTKMYVTRSARRLDAEVASKNTNHIVDILAWTWLLGNCEAHAAISEYGGTIVSYEDLANSAEFEMRPLFMKLGLAWSDSTTNFLRSFSKSNEHYFSIKRDPDFAMNRWKREMDREHIARVQRIVSRDPIGQKYFS